MRERRGQTEPLAAIAAVMAVVIGLTMYAGYVTERYPGTSDRAVEGVTLERIWNDVGSDGLFDERRDDLSGVTHGLPDGYNVYVEITTDELQDPETVAKLYVDADGTTRTETPDPPDDARTASRPIGLQLADDPGNVNTGTLRVVVWSR
ncbi:DUF7285 family protein [Natrialbaceae archaeon A-gly3]